jgi:hypothetical protein
MFGIWSAYGQQYLLIFFSINSYFILGSIISCPYLVGSHDALDCSGAHRLGGLFWVKATELQLYFKSSTCFWL